MPSEKTCAKELHMLSDNLHDFGRRDRDHRSKWKMIVLLKP